MWHDLWPWLLGALVIGLGLVALWLVLRRPPRPTADPQDHTDAMRLWREGRLTEARDALRALVKDDTAPSEAYLNLGTLYRLTGDAGRAAAMHRTLAVRTGLSRRRRVAVGLELAADLIALGRADEAADVLAQLASHTRHTARWYRLRFEAAAGRDDVEAADRALREGEKNLAGEPARAMADTRAAWLVDRALQEVRAGDVEAARGTLRRTRGLPAAQGRATLVRALVAAREDDADALVRAVERGLAEYPAEIAPALATLEGELAGAGRFMRALPALEQACSRDDAPPSIWMALARLYEKLGRRDDALRLLASKRGDPRLTPDAAAPYLRLLTADVPDAAFSRLWNVLSDPQRDRRFACASCGRQEDEIRWFCPSCLAADSFEPVCGVAAATAAVTLPQGPPRY